MRRAAKGPDVAVKGGADQDEAAPGHRWTTKVGRADLERQREVRRVAEAPERDLLRDLAGREFDGRELSPERGLHGIPSGDVTSARRS